MSQNEKSVSAANAALEAHAKALGIEGDPSIQLWHLLASLSEWAAVNGVSIDAELKDLNETLDSGELNLPAAEAARQAVQEGVASGGLRARGLPAGFTALISSVLKPGVDPFDQSQHDRPRG